MLLHWIWYAESKLTAQQKRLLLAYFHDPEEIYYADENAFRRIEGITAAAQKVLENKDLSGARKILTDCERKGIGVVAFTDSSYPASLRSLVDAPMLLYYKGSLPHWEEAPAVGIVGTRKATPYGCNTAMRFGREIAACGALVVSGGADGIDTVAMQGALDMGCSVVGVLGCGVDIVYPQKNRAFFEKVIQKGCLISEYPPGTSPLAWHFPQRNRIISGISNAILVVEAPEKSGALNTARHALEQGRDVFAVPGNVDIPSSYGTNALIQEGARAAIHGWDVVRDYAPLYPERLMQRQALPTEEPPVDKKSIDNGEKSTYSVVNINPPALSEAEQEILELICREGSLVDEVIAQSTQSPGTVKSVLTRLALKQLIVQHPGGRVSRK